VITGSQSLAFGHVGEQQEHVGVQSGREQGCSEVLVEDGLADDAGFLDFGGG